MDRYNTGFIGDFFGLLYPPLCAACGEALMRNEKVLCLNCLVELPRTKFHDDPDNEVARMFWGRVPLEYATAFMYFYKDSKYRQILHELKYHGQQHIGKEMGRMFGTALKPTVFCQADLIVPVPLHRRKKRKRGYNQSAVIAGGMAETMGKPCCEKAIVRMVNTDSQTSRSRFERWENVEDIFVVKQPELLKNKHVLLVDDVVTTGSTLEACAASLLKQGNIRVSVAALAYVKMD